MSLLPFSIFKQSGQEYEVVDKAARTDITQLGSDLNNKVNKNWTMISSSTDLSNYNELLIVFVTDYGRIVTNVPLTAASDVPATFIAEDSSHSSITFKLSKTTFGPVTGNANYGIYAR